MFDLPTRRLTLANGLTTRLHDSGGPGAAIVLLHGLALAIEIWGKVIPKLAETYRVITFDFPGYGEADRPDARYDAAFFVAQTVATMDALGLQRAHIIGSSLGASTVVRMSADHQHRIDHAVLMAPGGFGRAAHIALRAPTLPLIGYPLGKPTWLSNAFALRLSMADPRVATRALIDCMNVYTQRPGTHRAFVRTVKAGLGPFGVRERPSFASAAKQLERPTLVLWGEQDHIFPVKQAKIASALLPNARVERITNCGHYPHWEQPARFLAEVEAFLPQALT